jgi:hypothetical protein
LAAPKAIQVLSGSLHRLFRPQKQGRRSGNRFTSVPAVPACGLHVNAISGCEGGAVIAKKLNYALACDIEPPSFCLVPGESRRCRPTTGRSKRVFALTEILRGGLRNVILPTITHQWVVVSGPGLTRHLTCESLAPQLSASRSRRSSHQSYSLGNTRLTQEVAFRVHIIERAGDKYVDLFPIRPCSFAQYEFSGSN